MMGRYGSCQTPLIHSSASHFIPIMLLIHILRPRTSAWDKECCTHTHTHTQRRMLWGNNIIIESWKWAARWRWIFSTGRQSLLCYSDDDYKTVTVVNHYIQALFSFFPFPSLLQLPVIVKYISEKSTNLMYFPQYSFFLSCFFMSL